MAIGNSGLDTISFEGVVPQCRMRNAFDTQSFVFRLITDDQKRAQKRAKVNGIIDGNSPYNASKLREAGRAEAANFNFGRARSYMESGSGSFYDLFSEAPGYITVRTAHGTPEEKEEWSNGISEEADRTLRDDKTWDYEMSLSIDNMVLHGPGPLMFEDTQRILPKAFLAGDLKVPEFTKSESKYWEACMVQAIYYPPELYEFIQNEEAATAVGWNVPFVKKVIESAMDIRRTAGVQYNWEFYQAEMKNNTLSYIGNSKICRIAHVYWKEFDGRITHAMVEQNLTSGAGNEYLFISVGRYADFSQAVHAMYFDHGNGGYHHSVTGLGVKMFGAMSGENRLLNDLYDKAFSPKTLIRPTTASASQKLQLTRMGNYELLPPGVEFQQTPLQGMIQEGVGVYELISGINSNVLSTYKQPSMQKSGNPVTKYEKELEASIMSALSKTQYNRYYAQLDALYCEIYRRMINLNSTDKRAQDFQKRCKQRGIPMEALARTELVQATRVVGQGSAFMRKQALDSLIPMAGAMPEEGKDNLIRDKIAAEAGQSAVNRYFPRRQQMMGTDQQAEAMLQVAAMKISVPPVITSSQSPVIFAMTFLQAAIQSLQSLQQGGNPPDVLRFLNIIGSAIGAHLQRFAQDPTRQAIHDQLEGQWKQVAAATDALKMKLQQAAQQQQAQQQKTNGAMSDEQIAQAKLSADIQLKNQKQQAQLQQKTQSHNLKIAQSVQDSQVKTADKLQEMRLRDLAQAHALHLDRIESEHQRNLDRLSQVSSQD